MVDNTLPDAALLSEDEVIDTHSDNESSSAAFDFLLMIVTASDFEA